MSSARPKKPANLPRGWLYLGVLRMRSGKRVLPMYEIAFRIIRRKK